MLERFGNSTQMRVRRASTIAADNIATHAQRISKSAMEIRQAAQHIPLRDFLETHMPVNRTVNLTTQDPMSVFISLFLLGIGECGSLLFELHEHCLERTDRTGMFLGPQLRTM